MEKKLSLFIAGTIVLLLIAGAIFFNSNPAQEKFCNEEMKCESFIYDDYTFYDLDESFDNEELCKMAKQIINDKEYKLKEDCSENNINETVKAYGVTLRVSKKMKNYQFSMVVTKESESLFYFFS